MKGIKQAKWIEAERRGNRMPVFGKDLWLNEIPGKAVIEICGLGQFALFINDHEVNEGVYEPGWTNYRKTCLYSVYDVTGTLRKGKNRLRVMIGNGMYHVDGERYVKFRGSFGPPRLAAALRLSFENREETVMTDESWSACYGPIMYSCVYGEEVWMPRFTYYGQRYVVIETEAEILRVRAKEQCAACPQTGSFCCSNDMYNKIHKLILGAVRSNMQSVFTDCPHREKLGWLEETHLIGPGIMADYDARMLYEKILCDMADAQTEEGMVPDICPEYVEFELGFRASPEWGSACVLVPWYLYKRYGDKRIPETFFSTAEKYVDYLLGKSRNYIVNYGLGDWLDVGHYEMHPANTPIPVTATAILYQDLCAMADMSGVLGRSREKEKYEALAEKCAKSFNEAFCYPLSGTYATGSQTANAMALFLDLPDEENRERVLKNLLNDIEARSGHFTGGDIGHPYILRALAKYGENEVIAENLMKTDFPGYGYQVVCGATTLCEDWKGPDPERPVLSQNHFMLGAAEEWFYTSLAGIQVNAFNGEESIRIAPCFVKEADWVDCSMLTPAGICRVEWKRENKNIRVAVTLEKEGTIRFAFGKTEEVIRM